jgi:alpha-beta hydrolase superfamily lysophospholipase
MAALNRKKIWKWIKIAVLIYVLVGVALYFLQDKLLFHPEKLPSGYKYQFDIPFREINYPITKEKNLNVVEFTVPDSSCKGIVLYFHGNRKNITRYAPFATNFTRNGYQVWMMDYPGFGKSTGKRSEQAIYDDALWLYRMANRKYPADSIIIYGKSIGTGIAAQLAMVRDCKRLILETPYYSIDALARKYFFMYPVIPMTEYAFPTNLYFEYISSPVHIFHGTRDEVIPYKHALWLVEKKPTAELITIDKGKHNNLNDFPLFHHKLDSLLSL